MIVYGRNPVREALRGRRTVKRVWATPGAAREEWLVGVDALLTCPALSSLGELGHRLAGDERGVITAEYLVIAATLVFLKSRALLPPIPAEFLEEGESPEEVEERLRQRLIAYSKYREVGEDLRQRQFEASSYFFRDLGDVQQYRLTPFLDGQLA